MKRWRELFHDGADLIDGRGQEEGEDGVKADGEKRPAPVSGLFDETGHGDKTAGALFCSLSRLVG